MELRNINGRLCVHRPVKRYMQLARFLDNLFKILSINSLIQHSQLNNSAPNQTNFLTLKAGEDILNAVIIEGPH